jgi:co-chaperonin GroES (HSP10)
MLLELALEKMDSLMALEKSKKLTASGVVPPEAEKTKSRWGRVF